MHTYQVYGLIFSSSKSMFIRKQDLKVFERRFHALAKRIASVFAVCFHFVTPFESIQKYPVRTEQSRTIKENL